MAEKGGGVSVIIGAYSGSLTRWKQLDQKGRVMVLKFI